MNHVNHEARSLRCQRCGATFPLQALTPSVTCPYCRSEQPVPPALLHQLGHYEQQLAAHAASVEAADRAASHARQMDADIGAFRGKSLWVGYLVMFGPMCLIQGMVWVLEQLGQIPKPMRAEVEAIAQVVSGLSFAIAFPGYLAYHASRTRSRIRTGPIAPISAVVCASCGAPNVLAPGQILSACRFCRAALLPTQAVMQRTLSVAEIEARRARMQHYRVERGSGEGSLLPARLVHVALSIVLVLMAVAAGYLVPIGLLASYRELRPYAQEVTIGGFVLGGLVALVLVMVLFRDLGRQGRWDSALSALAAKLGGQRLDAAMTLQWLNQHWAGPFVPGEIHVDTCGGAIAAKLDMFPALMIIDAVKSSTRPDDLGSPKVILLVAAVFPGGTTLVRGPLVDRVTQRGMTPILNEGGIAARMGDLPGDDAVERFANDPGQTLQLAEVLGALARLAAMSGGRPAEPM
ncbi:MAG: hypothetical protein U0359_21105 [Byssovorax sp.]